MIDDNLGVFDPFTPETFRLEKNYPVQAKSFQAKTITISHPRAKATEVESLVYLVPVGIFAGFLGVMAIFAIERGIEKFVDKANHYLTTVKERNEFDETNRKKP